MKIASFILPALLSVGLLAPVFAQQVREASPPRGPIKIQPVPRPLPGKGRPLPIRPGGQAPQKAPVNWAQQQLVFIGTLDTVVAGPVGRSFPPMFTHKLNFTVKEVIRGNLKAGVFGGEKMVRLTDDWSFTGGGAMLSDDNSNLTDKYESSITGFLIDGTISYDVFNFGGEQVSFSLIGGLGMMTVTPFNNPSYFKTGFSFSVAEQLTLNYHYMAMLSTAESATASGASIISIGWKF